ncbi:hypothetical protein HPB49_026625 [Dermacentor silvarum]|nr:hypothetical protein HPB49_026625 [Dermacentor silvarum]
MWTHLGVSGKLDKAKNFFEHPVNEDRKVFAFSDVPHLFKYIRNRLLKQRLLKVNGQWVKWDLYTAVYKEDCKNAGGLKVCPKITEHHIYPSKMELMRVKLATQVFSRSMCSGIKFYADQKVLNLQEAAGTIAFTERMNDLFDSMNRRHPIEGVRHGSRDLTVIRDSIQWLDDWERELQSGAIMKEMFLTSTTAEGLRVTMLSTLALAEYLLSKCDYKYVLTAKFNQDPLERFFGKARQAACDNDHPDMPTFLQLYRMLSVYSLLKPPRFGNCEVIEENPALDLSEFRKIFQKADNDPSHLEQLKAKLDGLVETGDWDLDDAVQDSQKKL